MAGYQIDWQQVETPFGNDPATAAPSGDLPALIGRLEHEAEQWLGRRPPPQVFDALAWYLPIHYWGDEYGIYITEQAIAFLAAGVWREMPADRRHDPDVVYRTFRVALTLLYLHEAFHHRVESFATRLEIVERVRRYQAYDTSVYNKVAMTDGCLEEALAGAKFFQRSGEQVYRRSVPYDLCAAALPFVRDFFAQLPPGYRRAVD
ncbi:MAG: hypothetical protein ACKO91_15840, partial [Acidimicrobiales bacterium]